MKQTNGPGNSSITSSTAQSGGGSFKIGNIKERLVCVNDGWQSKSTDGLKSGWRQGSVVVVVLVGVVVVAPCGVV